MVMRKKTGWEGMKDDPVLFFDEILRLRTTREQRLMLLDIVSGDELRVGIVWDAVEDKLDAAAFVAGLMLWRAATCHTPTVLWGGRRSVAVAWLDHTFMVLQGSCQEFRSDFTIYKGKRDKAWGLKLPNGAWAVRFDGCFASDARNACDEMGDMADVLIHDFAWTDGDSINEALEYSDDNEAVASLLISHGVS